LWQESERARGAVGWRIPMHERAMMVRRSTLGVQRCLADWAMLRVSNATL
jgi:hypothetical protein